MNCFHLFRKDDTKNTFGSQHIAEKTGKRVFMKNHEDTYEKIFGQCEPRCIGECVEEDEDTFDSIFGIKRQAETQCYC